MHAWLSAFCDGLDAGMAERAVFKARRRREMRRRIAEGEAALWAVAALLAALTGMLAAPMFWGP